MYMMFSGPNNRSLVEQKKMQGLRINLKTWLPKKFRQVYDACTSFQKYMTRVYEEEKLAFVRGESGDRNFMTPLVRASQDETAKSSSLGGLT